MALREQGYRCFYCKCPLEPNEATADHAHPKKPRGKLEKENIVAACYPCNQAKGGLFSQQFFTLINKSKPPKGEHTEILMAWASRRIWRRSAFNELKSYKE